MVPRLKVAPLRSVFNLLEPAHSLGYVADARQRFSGRPDELEAASGASRLRHIPPAGGDPRVHLVGARGSVEPRAPARDGLMERDAMMRIPFLLAQRLKAGECGAVVAGGDRGDEPPHPREYRWPRRLADAFRERLTFLGHLLSLDQAAAQVPRLGEPRPDVEGDPRKERAARPQPGRCELLLAFCEASQKCESRATPEARLQRCLDAGSGCNPCQLLYQRQHVLRLVRLHRVHAGEDEGALVRALEAWLECLRRTGRNGEGARAVERGDRDAPRILRAVLEPPRDRCVRSLELQEQNRVVAAGTASALEVCARFIGPLELLCRIGCTQPGARAITRLTQPFSDARPTLHRKPVLTELRGQGCEV